MKDDDYCTMPDGERVFVPRPRPGAPTGNQNARKHPRTVQVGLRIPEPMNSNLAHIAEQRGISKSALIVEILSKSLK